MVIGPVDYLLLQLPLMVVNGGNNA